MSRTILRCLFVATLLLMSGRMQAASRPNVILFLVDDMGWRDSSPYGSRYYETPNMERFSQQAMRFTDAYALPLCSPTRASILTGKYTSRHGVTSATGHRPPQPESATLLPASASPRQRWIYPESRNYLQPQEFTLAEALHEAGYRTGHFGKWHLGLTAPYWPDRQGFDVAFHGKPDPGPGSYFSPYSFRSYQSFPDGPPGEYITDRLTEEAIKFIDAASDQPFFLNLWHYGVHGPWGHKEEYTRRFAEKSDPLGHQGNPIMASMLFSIDESLGRILDHLDKRQIADQTIVIFYSDNGGNTHSNTPDDRKRAKIGPNHPKAALLEDWQHWAGGRPPTNNSPLRDGKGRLYEGGIRVPLMVRWPGVIPPGTTSDAVIGPIDMYPTILDMVGLPKPTRQQIDGVSFLPVLKQSAPLDPRPYFTWFPHLVPGVAVRQGNWKLIRRYEPTEEYPDGFELFNLETDLGEQHNLASKMPEKVAELDALIDGFLEETHALQPVPNPDFRETLAPKTRPLLGWVPKFTDAEMTPAGLRVHPTGKKPFIAKTGLNIPGPLQMLLSLRAPAGGTGSVQWRCRDQESFPETGQQVSFKIPGQDASQTIPIPLPVQGRLLHLRLYLPREAREMTIESIRLQQQAGDQSHETWDFTGQNAGQRPSVRNVPPR